MKLYFRATTALVALAGLTAAASAADLPRRAAPPPVFTPVPVFTWTGFYAGLESAYTFTDNQRINTVGVLPANATNVALGRRPASVTTSRICGNSSSLTASHTAGEAWTAHHIVPVSLS